MGKTIALIATLDTKAREAEYVRSRIQAHGEDALLIDVGVLGQPQGIEPDISRTQVASYGNHDLSQIRQASSRAEAMTMMAEGVKGLLRQLYETKRIDGVMCIAGSGSAIATPGMQALPIGFPKLLVCPLLSGERVFEPFVGTSDIVLMHSIVDILGVNEISRKIFDNAVGAMTGMIDRDASTTTKGRNLIGITMFGQTTPGVMTARDELEKKGYQCVIFHANGVGGRCMEELIGEGTFVGILDYTLSEVAGQELGGLNKSSPTRMEIAGKYGIPQVIVPGCIDFLDVRPSDVEKEGFGDRKIYSHSSDFALVRTTKDEMIRLGKVFAQKLNSARGPVEIIYPKLGFSAVNARGRELYDPEADRAFLETLKKNLTNKIPLREREAHINDSNFARFAANRLIELIEKRCSSN